jgi:two-component system chemotaxis response regulator CheB
VTGAVPPDRVLTSQIIVIGASLGGLNALRTLLAGLPDKLSAPVVIVQHRGAGLDDMLAAMLQRHTALLLADAEDKEVLAAGHVYLAPADYHLLIEDESFALSTGPAVRHSRPSIDVLFESAADVYGSRTIGVILTGANADGALGLRAIQMRGGIAVVQDPATAESIAMPTAAIAATRTDRILPIEAIPPLLVRLVRACGSGNGGSQAI